MRSHTLAELIDAYMAAYAGADRAIGSRLAYWRLLRRLLPTISRTRFSTWASSARELSSGVTSKARGTLQAALTHAGRDDRQSLSHLLGQRLQVGTAQAPAAARLCLAHARCGTRARKQYPACATSTQPSAYFPECNYLDSPELCSRRGGIHGRTVFESFRGAGRQCFTRKHHEWRNNGCR